MKKITYIRGTLVVCIGILLLFTAACNRDTTHTKKDPTTSKQPTKEPEPTRSPETSMKPTKEPEPTDNGFIPIPEQVTDQATLIGLSNALLETMSLEEKIGQLFIVELESLDSSHGSIYEYRKITDNMITTLKTYPVGGVMLFARNIEMREQTKKLIEDLQTNSQIPLFIGVEEEGGAASKIASNKNMDMTAILDASELALKQEEKAGYEAAKTIGEEIRQLGFNLNLAPVADVQSVDDELRKNMYATDPKLVSTMVRQTVSGLKEEAICTTLKHFPGEGSIASERDGDNYGIESELEELRKNSFPPFKAGIDAGADIIMVSHATVCKVTSDEIPASMNSVVLNEMLRMELEFKGIIMTDQMNKRAITSKYSPDKAAVEAIKAGSDVILMPESLEIAYEAVKKAVQSGEISEERINESVQRILSLKIQNGIINEESEIVSRME